MFCPFSINFHYGGVKPKEINKKQNKNKTKTKTRWPRWKWYSTYARGIYIFVSLFNFPWNTLSRVWCINKYDLLRSKMLRALAWSYYRDFIKKENLKKTVSRTNTIYLDNCFKLLFVMKNSFYFIESEVSLVIPFLFLNKKNHSRQETWKQLMYKKATSY